jgi:aryl-alcohol dehydrogenase-like predicted oxidoreductase
MTEPTVHTPPDAASTAWSRSAMGTGTWAWGDTLVWGYGGGYSDADLRAAYEASVNSGITLFDTAEMYGFGKSERLLGQFMREVPAHVEIATKFFPVPWRFRPAQLMNALRGSLNRLGVRRVALYQIHWPTPIVHPETWAGALADALDAGLTEAVGVSNYGRRDVLRAVHTLALRGHVLASNQVEYSLINRKIERDGTFDACRERGVRIIAYSPLGMGLLTGKYTPENPPQGVRGLNKARLAAVQPLIAVLRRIGEGYGKSPAQVALNWTIAKGTVPIPGAKSARQLEHNAGALGWALTSDEVAELDEASAPVAF